MNQIFDYKQIIIGPSLIFTEHMLLGYPMETCKILKQNTGKPYPVIIKDMLSKGISRGLYTSYIPHGILQTFKGAPLLFAQSSSQNYLNKYYTNKSSFEINCISGMVGGAFQGFCITPLQRSRTIVSTNNNLQKSTKEILNSVIKKEGVFTLFKGIEFTIIKRSIDWGIRFGTQDIILKKITKENEEISLQKKLLSGFGAGLLSCISTPLDVAISISQGYNKKNIPSYELLKENYKNNGIKIFLRGGIAKTIHSVYSVSIIFSLKSTYEYYYDKYIL